jgi:hypothetical protein
MFKRYVPLLALLVLFAPRPAYAFLGIGDTGDGVLAAIYSQNVQQASSLATQVQQLRSMLANARETLSIARNVYAGVEMLKHGDAMQFLQMARREFQVVDVGMDALNLYNDVERNGLHGGYFDPRSLANQILSFKKRITGSDPRTAPQPGTFETMYSAQDALGLSKQLQSLTTSLAWRARAGDEHMPPELIRPPAASATQGLIVYDAARSDATLAAVYADQRTRNMLAAQIATENYALSLGATPGQAQVLAARTTALTAQQLASLNDTANEELLLHRLEYAKNATTAQVQRNEQDAFWQGMAGALDKGFAPSSVPTSPDLSGR